MGVGLAIAVALHNIPEGASIAIPIYYATGKKWKGLFWTFVTGMSEPLGKCSQEHIKGRSIHLGLSKNEENYIDIS